MQMIKVVMGLLLVGCVNSASALPFSFNSHDVPEDIPENPTTTLGNTYSYMMTIGAAGIISDLNVYVDIDHTWTGDLDIYISDLLTGTTVHLFDQHGGSGNDITGVTFDDEAATVISSADAPFGPGTFRGVQSLTAFDGLSLASVWELTIVDNYHADVGTLWNWGIRGETADVPEPGNLVLIGLGILGISLARKRHM